VPLSIAKAFSAATIPLNGTTTLTFTIQNPSASAETGVAFTDSLPVGLVVAVTPNLTNTCGGTATAAAGSGSVALSAGTLAGTASCTVSVTVRGAFAGVNNNSVQVSSNEGGVGNTANASITVVAPPTIAKAFGAASIPVGSVTSLTFTITNPNAATTLTGVGFTDTLPAGLVIATPNALTGSCGGGTITATAGSGSISLTGAALAGSASCTFSVNVTGMSAGVKSNTTGAVTSVEGGTGGTASAIVTVGAVLPPTIAKVFGAGTVALNGMTSLSFTLTNPNAASTLTGIGFTDTLPAGLVVATPNGLIGTCGGGVITATAGSGSISLTGAALAGSASCTFSVNVVGTSAGTELNTTGAVTSVEGGTGGTASAGIVVVGAAPTAATIPTLQQWALVLLGLILAAAAGISLCSPRKE